jgi:trans-feruloyl-CoA hydratase/vanillin synthase
MSDVKDIVVYEVVDNVAWVKYNRPEKRNCMSPNVNRRMLEVLNELEYRDDVGVLVLSGEGEAFSAGMDLKEYFKENEAKGLGAVRQAQREAYTWWERLRWFQKPTIGMINGWCFGGAYGPLLFLSTSLTGRLHLVQTVYYVSPLLKFRRLT